MYVIQKDLEILRSDEVQAMEKEYHEKFGEWFAYFNYIDFQRKGDKRAAQVYKEALEEALTKDEPTRIESHRYDIFDH